MTMSRLTKNYHAVAMQECINEHREANDIPGEVIGLMRSGIHEIERTQEELDRVNALLGAAKRAFKFAESQQYTMIQLIDDSLKDIDERER